MPTRIGNNSFAGSFERQRIYIPWGLLDTLPWHNTRIRAWNAFAARYVRVKCTRPGDTISFKDQDQEYSVALHHRSRLSLNIPGVPLTSPSKRESRVTRKRNGRKGSVQGSGEKRKEEENKEGEEETKFEIRKRKRKRMTTNSLFKSSYGISPRLTFTYN